MTPAELAEKLEALLAFRDKAALATTVPFQPADACWSIAEYCGEDEDLVANSMSFNVAKFFSEVSNQSPDLLRQAATRLRSMEEAPSAAMIARGVEILDDRYDLQLPAGGTSTFAEIAEDLWCAMQDVAARAALQGEGQ